MDASLTYEQVSLKETVADFCMRECPPEDVRDWERTGEFPRGVWEKLATTGVAGLAFSEEYGGGGGSVVDEAIVMQTLSHWANPLANVFLTTVSFGGYSIETFGSEEQKRTLMPRLANGDLIMAFALTEPGGGTDVLRNIRTTARRDGDGFVVNGQKIFSTSADVADLLVVVTRTSEGARPRDGLTIMLVDPRAPGVEIHPQEKAGNSPPHSCTIFFSDVRVPASDVLGVVGDGWRNLVGTLNNERILIAAECVGLGQAAVEHAVGYVRQREAFGRPIAEFQSIRHHLATARMEMDAAELQMLKAAWLQTQGLPCALDAVMAKYYAAEAGVRATSRAMQVLGGHGYVDDHPIERHWRDVRLYTLGPITSEMCLNQIGESLGLPRSY